MGEASEGFIPASGYDESKGRFTRFDPGTRVLPAGFRFGPGYRPLDEDIVFEKDTAVPLRDGTTIYTDVFRPVGPGPFPTIVAWSPYGKTTGTSRVYTMIRFLLGIPRGQLSGLMKWEAADPAWWCARGYAVCQPDTRGVGRSEGDIQLFGEQEGRDGADFVEWCAQQPWCDGNVGLEGNSWLSVSQWFTAAERPPHLKAIAPWEGFSDVYRDQIAPGGVPDPGFFHFLAEGLPGRQMVQDPTVAIARHPLFDEFWQSKAARIENIDVPAYVVASYGSTVHAAGTFRAWERLVTPHRWLRIHDTQEWPDFYQEKHQEDLLRFFDHYLKGIDNGWEQTPRVRYSVLDLEGGNTSDHPSETWPPADSVEKTYFLDAASKKFVAEAPSIAAISRYDSESDGANGRFELTLRVDEETEFVGYPRVSLFMEADGYDDMDVFVLLQKLDRHGRHLTPPAAGHANPLARFLTRHDGSVLRYKASLGRQRASLRALDAELSSEQVPVPSYRTSERLKPGEIVRLDIALYPVGLKLHPGESLRLVVTGTNLNGSPMLFKPEQPASDNHGQHIVHTGGEHASHLVLPVMRKTTLH